MDGFNGRRERRREKRKMFLHGTCRFVHLKIAQIENKKKPRCSVFLRGCCQKKQSRKLTAVNSLEKWGSWQVKEVNNIFPIPLSLSGEKHHSLTWLTPSHPIPSTSRDIKVEPIDFSQAKNKKTPRILWLLYNGHRGAMKSRVVRPVPGHFWSTWSTICHRVIHGDSNDHSSSSDDDDDDNDGKPSPHNGFRFWRTSIWVHLWHRPWFFSVVLGWQIRDEVCHVECSPVVRRSA